MSRPVLAAISLVVLALVCTPAVSFACVLNNQASLSADGHAAVRDLGAGTTLFRFERVYGRGGSIRFAENMADLRQSLSTAELTHPFLWRWGDGTYSIARAPAHVYRRSGTFQVAVYAFGAREAEAWAPFDRVRIQIVPPGEVWRDNLLYTVLDAFGFTLHWAVRLGFVALALAIAYGFWLERKRHPVRTGQIPTVSSSAQLGPE